jgi:carbon monoxide dehydrogenase subunit G
MKFLELYLFLGYQNLSGGFMKLQGSAEIGMPKAKAFEILKDPEKIAKLIPGIQSFEKEGDGVKMSVMVGYSFIKGRFNVKLAKTREENGSHVELKGSGSGAGTSIDFLSKFDIEAKGEDSSILSWDADVNVGGIAATMGGSMIKSAAEKFISQIVDSLKHGTAGYTTT